MKQINLVLSLLACLGLTTAGLSQQPSPQPLLHLYDSFNEDLINPAKWYSQWGCGSPSVMECVRGIQDEQLHLRVRAYGTPDSNQGNQYGVSELYLTSTQVTDISTQATIQRTSAQGCPTNVAGAHGQALLFGSFFNGGGTAADDVQAFLQFDRYSTDAPGVVEVGGFLFYQGQFFGHIDLGPVNVGERVSVELKWDQPNHRFIARLTRPTFNSFAEQYMPYSASDTTPAVAPFKVLSARAFPVNCVGTRAPAEMSVNFDNVMTN